MAEKIVSPGVFTKEIDASFLPAAIGDIGAVVIGPTVKGPALVPTVVSSYGEFQAKFGDTFKSGSSYYQYLTSHTAKNYLQHSGKMTVVRIMGSGYSHASATVSSSVDPSIVGGGVKASASIGFYLTHSADDQRGVFRGIDNFMSMSIGGVQFILTDNPASQSLNTTVGGPLYVMSASEGAGEFTNAKFADQFRDILNNSSSIHGLTLSASSENHKLTMSYDYAGDFETSLLGGTGKSGLRTYPTITSGNLHYETNTEFSMSFEAFQGGRDDNAGVQEAVFKLHTLADGIQMNNSSYGPHIGINGSGSIGTNSVLSNGTKDNVRWEIGSLNQKKGTFSLVIRKGDDTHKRKSILETWNNVSLDPNQNNYIAKVVGDQDISIEGTVNDPYLTYTGEYPNMSKYVRVEVIKQTLDYLDENGNVRLPQASASLPTFHSGSNSGSLGGGFQGGTDGTVSTPANFYEAIGQQTQGFDLNNSAQQDQYIQALNLLSNQDEYDFNLMLLPGVIRNQTGHTAIITKAIDVCEKRGDAFVIVDTVAHDTALGTVTTEAKTMDSNYAATYWPWVQISDQQIGKNRWVPPSVSMAGTLAFNDKVGAPWFAPAGLNRGVIQNVVQAERGLTHKNRDTLYESNVNPLATFPGQGVVVWGQKTLQKKSSALDRVNVRRLMIKVKKFIAASSRFLVFEQNTAQTRERFLNIANPFLEQVQSQSGLNAFKVVMDESNNTPDVVDRNILYGQIFVQPTRTAEFIVLDFTIQPTGATFPE